MFPYGEDMMKQWYENWEKMMGASLEKMVRNDKFVQEMSRAIAATMSGKAQYARLVDEQLAAMNLPSRTDMVRALQKLTDLEERVIDLQERVEDLQAALRVVPDAPAVETTKAAEPETKKTGRRKTRMEKTAKPAARKTRRTA